MNRYQSRIYLIILFSIFWSGCHIKKEIQFNGKTMGTTYHIKVVSFLCSNHNELHDKLKECLSTIENQMSTYRKESDLSRFNRMAGGERIKVSDSLIAVILEAQKIYHLTDGAWDGTINPIVNEWGFGGERRSPKIPENAVIASLLAKIGFHHIQIEDNNYLVKKKDGVTLDLASIAKGYAVDQAAKLIRKYKINDFLVEIGGEIYSSGVRPDGKQWKVGINIPHKNAGLRQVYTTLSITNQAMATSGDYRIFFEANGKIYSHVIDPKTGYPVSNGIASVSIIAPSCTFADGLATAIMVMGHEKGLGLINRLENVEGLIIVRKDSHTFVDYSSEGLILE